MFLVSVLDCSGYFFGSVIATCLGQNVAFLRFGPQEVQDLFKSEVLV